MNSNGLDNGLANGRLDNSFVGFANGLVGSEQMISEANTFIFTIRTTSTRTLDLPLVVGGTYRFWVDWGDGKKDYIYLYNQAIATHTYPTALRNYTVKITGVCKGWSYFGLTNEQPKLISVERWGCLELLNDATNGGYFGNCVNMDLSGVKDVLNLGDVTNMFGVLYETNFQVNLISNWNFSKVTSISFMFQNASVFNQPLGGWNTESITNMFGVFSSASEFNQDINSWNTGSVTNMSSMFISASKFNQPLYDWNTSGVTNMTNMFSSASAFNQDINSWDVSRVITMPSLFGGASAFNQPLYDWNTSGVTNMSFMFQNATMFNQDINNWDVSKVTNISNMFNNAKAFNQPLSGWNTSACTIMFNIFNGADAFNGYINSWNVSKVTLFDGVFANALAFNQPLSGWNTSSATSMTEMFNNAIAFNQNINSWNVSKVTNMTAMFQNATAFNEPLSGWNTSACTAMSQMFSNANTFNQPIESWDVSRVTQMNNMFDGIEGEMVFNQPLSGWNVSACTTFINFMSGKIPETFSTTNLDGIYNGWIRNELKKNVSISFGSAKHTTGSTESKALLNRASVVDLTITGFTNSGGLVRIGVSGATGLNTNNKIFIKNVNPSYVNGLWSITTATTTTFNLQGSTYGAPYVSGGTLIRTYGWTIVDGGT